MNKKIMKYCRPVLHDVNSANKLAFCDNGSSAVGFGYYETGCGTGSSANIKLACLGGNVPIDFCLGGGSVGFVIGSSCAPGPADDNDYYYGCTNGDRPSESACKSGSGT